MVKYFWKERRGNCISQLFLQQCCITTTAILSGLKLKSFILILMISRSAATWLGWAGPLIPGSRFSRSQCEFRSALSLFHLPWPSGYLVWVVCSPCLTLVPKGRGRGYWGHVVLWQTVEHKKTCAVHKPSSRVWSCQAQFKGVIMSHPLIVSCHVHWPEQALWPGPKSCFPVGDRNPWSIFQSWCCLCPCRPGVPQVQRLPFNLNSAWKRFPKTKSKRPDTKVLDFLLQEENQTQICLGQDWAGCSVICTEQEGGCGFLQPRNKALGRAGRVRWGRTEVTAKHRQDTWVSTRVHPSFLHRLLPYNGPQMDSLIDFALKITFIGFSDFKSNT